MSNTPKRIFKIILILSTLIISISIFSYTLIYALPQYNDLAADRPLDKYLPIPSGIWGTVLVPLGFIVFVFIIKSVFRFLGKSRSLWKGGILGLIFGTWVALWLGVGRGVDFTLSIFAYTLIGIVLSFFLSRTDSKTRAKAIDMISVGKYKDRS